jgi:ubiquinone biosynthesis accessory factor UbiK
MAESRKVEEIAARLAQALPPGLKTLRAELEDNFRAILRANLERFDLVSRDRFDAQAELLARTQAKLEALEERLAALEKKA